MNMSQSASNTLPPRKKKQISPSPTDKSKKRQTPVTKTTKQNYSISTYLRIRPIFKNEEVMDYSINGNTIMIRPPPTSSYFCIDQSFTFQKIFDQKTSQEMIFNDVALPLLKHFMKGKDAFIFCNGCKNTGRKFTVNGSLDKPGLIRRTLDFIVPQLLGSIESQNVKLTSSYFEIYNEEIYDLLNTSKKETKLSSVVEKNGEMTINSIVEFKIRSVEDILSLIKKIISGIDKTINCFNHDISYSHIIFKLRLEWRKQISNLLIIALGQCQSYSDNNSSKYFKMNQSNLSLRKNIDLLKNSKTNIKSIPFRESKLTCVCKSLFDLQKPVKAAIINNISPSVLEVENSMFSQKFACESSKQYVRQVAKVDDIERKDLNLNVKVLTNVEPEVDETELEIEFRLRKQLKKDMQQYIIEKEKQYLNQIETIDSTCKNIFLSKLEAEILTTNSTKSIEDILKNKIELKEKYINKLIENISNEKAKEKKLIEQLQNAKEEIKQYDNKINKYYTCDEFHKSNN